jgi:hypothetical protein
MKGMKMESDFIIRKQFGHNFLMKYVGHESVPTIPEEVEIIGEGAFEKCDFITSIRIHESVSEIRENGFYRCNNLEDIEMLAKDPDSRQPQGVKTIGDSAFYKCTSLSKVKFPETLLRIGDSAFAGCGRISEVNIPNIIVIDSGAFAGCLSIKNVKIREDYTGLDEIGRYAFFSCRNLNTVLINAERTGIYGINSNAFAECLNLSTVVISGSINIIGDYAFRDCRNLTSILFTDVENLEIREGAFEGCKNLVIHAPKESYAIQYAKKNNIRFEEI